MIKPSWFLVAASLFSPVALAETTLGEQSAKNISPHAFKCSYQEALEKMQSPAVSSPDVVAKSAQPQKQIKAQAIAIDGNG